MAGAPAATLLHLGPGLGYGLANLHNARRAKVPVVSIVGDHATYHAQYDPPLQSDIETIARNVSTWVRTSRSAEELGRDAVEAIAAAVGPPGQVATLIVPADVSWQEGAPVAAPARPRGAAGPRRQRPSRPWRTCSAAATGSGSCSAGWPCAGTGCRPPRASPRLRERSCSRSGARRGSNAAPACPRWSGSCTGPSSRLSSSRGSSTSCWSTRVRPSRGLRIRERRVSCARMGVSCTSWRRRARTWSGRLEALVEALDASDARPAVRDAAVPARPTGALTAEKACQAIGAILPEGAIISDEAITSALALPASTAGAPRHDWLTLTGGAIGQGLPVAVGAAIACPDRPVIALEADGSALYTIQSLWTMAREQLDVTVVLFNNRGYAILDAELDRLDVKDAGDKARALLELVGPDLDFVKLGGGFGVPSRRVEDGEQLTGALEEALARTRTASDRGGPPRRLEVLTGIDRSRQLGAGRPGRCVAPRATCRCASGRTRSPGRSSRSARPAR